MRGVQLFLQPGHFGLELAHPSHRTGCARRAWHRACSGSGPATSPDDAPWRQAARWEVYNPSRRSSRPTSPGCVQRSASSRIRSRYSAVNWRRFGLATTSGSGAGLVPLARALGVSSLRSSTPRARAPTSFNVIDSLSVTIGSHLHRPTVIPRGAGVSSMLAERGGRASPSPASECTHHFRADTVLDGVPRTGYGIKQMVTRWTPPERRARVTGPTSPASILGARATHERARFGRGCGVISHWTEHSRAR